MVKLDNFSYDFDLNDADSDNKVIYAYITCKDSRDATIIMGELTRALNATNGLFNLREVKIDESN